MRPLVPCCWQWLQCSTNSTCSLRLYFIPNNLGLQQGKDSLCKTTKMHHIPYQCPSTFSISGSYTNFLDIEANSWFLLLSSLPITFGYQLLPSQSLVSLMCFFLYRRLCLTSYLVSQGTIPFQLLIFLSNMSSNSFFAIFHYPHKFFPIHLGIKPSLPSLSNRISFMPQFNSCNFPHLVINIYMLYFLY